MRVTIYGGGSELGVKSTDVSDSGETVTGMFQNCPVVLEEIL